MKYQIIIFVLAVLFPAVMLGQQTGIQWTTGLSWEQVKAKAKAENKHIFVDCHATWCGPCKMMDLEVFPLDSVGRFINEKYLAVKVQMDRTVNDDAAVRAWYADAAALEVEYQVNSFPTFLFFSPDGTLAYKQLGWMPPAAFLATARKGLQPGLVYTDSRERYEHSLKAYRQNRQLDSAYHLLELAGGYQDVAAEVELRGDIYKALSNQPKNALFTPERLQFMASITNHSTDRWFRLFYRESKRVNQVMEDAHFAQRLVDAIILDEVAFPYLGKDRVQMRDAMLMYGSGVQPDFAEADWKGLEKTIRKVYSVDYGKRCAQIAQFFWYKQHWNMPAFMDSYLDFVKHYGIGSSEWTGANRINDLCWYYIFESKTTGSLLNLAIECMAQVVEANAKVYSYCDTYACLLYQAGRRDEAIRWQRQAVELAGRNEYSMAMVQPLSTFLAKMENGEDLHVR